jgi:hypothetical protein
MGLFKDLFTNQVTLRDLKTALLKLERDRRKKQREMRKLSDRQGELIQEAKGARAKANDLEVDYLWEEISGIRTEQTMLRRDMRILNLEGIGLKRYVRGMERLEKQKNPNGVKKLIERIRTSDLDSKLGVANLREQEYLDELKLILEDVGLELDTAEEFEDDPEKAAFLSDLDGIVHAETAGDEESAQAKADALRTRLEREAAEGDA